jgi:PIN domain nuclease of toxin-antitoxin system
MLLDTHILIWDALTPSHLSPTAKQALATGKQQNNLFICDISLWEIAMLVEKGRVQVATDLQSFLNLLVQANNLKILPISTHIATVSVQLPEKVNKDPADRLIVATAISENLSLLTADQNLRSTHLITTIW